MAGGYAIIPMSKRKGGKRMLPFISPRLKTTMDISRIVHYLRLEVMPDFKDIPEQHDFWELVYVESGEAEAIADDRRIPMKPGMVLFHKPGEMHSVQILRPSVMHFYSLRSSSKAMQIFQNCRMTLTPELRRLLHVLFTETDNTFSRIVEEEQNKLVVREDAPFGGQQMCKLYLETFLLQAARLSRNTVQSPAYRSKEEYEANLYRTILMYLEENLYSDITLEQICQKMNYSRTYISALFKQHAGMSLIQYFNTMKIQEAKRLMETKNITETAECLGFGTPYYFSRVFSRVEGISPSRYRKENSQK